MRKKLPNSYCKKCHTFSMKHSNELCGNRMDDGMLCKGVLFSIPEGGLSECSSCAGTGTDGTRKCVACQGFGFEYIAQ